MTDAALKTYAADLLHRAGNDQFDPVDVAMVAGLLPLIDGDLADWLAMQPAQLVPAESVIHAVRRGAHRPGSGEAE